MKVYNLNKDKLERYDVQHQAWILQSGQVREIVSEFNLVIRTGFVYRCDKNGHVSPLKSTIRKNGVKSSWIQLGKYFGFDANWTQSLAEKATYYDLAKQEVEFESILEFG